MNAPSHETTQIPFQSDPPLEVQPIGFASFDKRVKEFMARDCGECVTARLVWLDDRGLLLESRTAGNIHQALALLEELTPCSHGKVDDIISDVEAVSGVRVAPLPESQDHSDIIASVEELRTRYNKADVTI